MIIHMTYLYIIRQSADFVLKGVEHESGHLLCSVANGPNQVRSATRANEQSVTCECLGDGERGIGRIGGNTKKTKRKRCDVSTQNL